MPRMPNVNQAPLPASVAREVAVAASVDPRTLRRYLRGASVANMCACRISRALKERGLEHLIRSTAA